MVKYHIFSYQKKANLVIVEGPGHQYLWLCLWVEKRSRKSGLTEDIAYYALTKLIGTHNIHFFPEISTLKKISKKLNWKYKGWSKYFVRCLAYKTTSKTSKKNNSSIAHRKRASRPKLKSFPNPRTAYYVERAFISDCKKYL